MTGQSGSLGVAPRRGRKIFFVLVLLALGAAIYARWIEPNWIDVTHHQLRAPLAAPLKIAHLTDVHTRGMGRRERAILRILDAEKPDLIVVTGDTLSNDATYDECRAFFSRLHAPLGVWAVRGNWENWKPVARERNFYSSAGVRLLVNESREVRPGVWVTGLDDPSSGWPDLGAALATAPRDVFTIALFHAPGFFEKAAGKFRLALTGHTHGGQVRLPFMGPLWLPSGCGRFVEGWYEKNGSKMYVSRGLGTSILQVRFLCRPELAFITIQP
ncbi:MAG TPA: metallophosphoesterase [Candidatus Acidoferrales bacterium]|nr:metallophosphoesterase [Candidatus Acidoferrales bacterium]